MARYTLAPLAVYGFVNNCALLQCMPLNAFENAANLRMFAGRELPSALVIDGWRSNRVRSGNGAGLRNRGIVAAGVARICGQSVAPLTLHR